MKKMLTSLVISLLAGSSFAAEDTKLIFSFVGKGTSLPWDMGVVEASMEAIPSLQTDKVIVAGNSSGSLFAAYFSCYGFNHQSVQYLKNSLAKMDPTLINERIEEKFKSLLAGKQIEYPISNLDAYLAMALTNPKNGKMDCPKLQLPMVITAANYAELDNRNPTQLIPGLDYKTVDYGNMSVWWKPEIVAHNPQIKDAYIGRACTYFVDSVMFKALQLIPEDERRCDLRLVRNVADLRLAITASAAEPTYFLPVVETDVSQLKPARRPVTGEEMKINKRSYYGGYIEPVVAQDVRRVSPNARLLSTGVYAYGGTAGVVIKNLCSADIVALGTLSKWWSDMDVVPDAMQWDIILSDRQKPLVQRAWSYEAFVQAGYDKAQECFSNDTCRPYAAWRPKYRTSVSDGLELQTQRGLADLLDRPLP